MTRPNQRIVQLGLTLLDHYALAAANAFEHLARERSLCDGFPARGDSAHRYGSTPTSSTESAVVAIDQIVADTERLRHAIAAAETAVNVLGSVIGDIRVPVAVAVVKRCRDGQVGKDAGLWSDELACVLLPDKKELCTKHYWQWRRYRIAHGIDTSGDFEATP